MYLSSGSGQKLAQDAAITSGHLQLFGESPIGDRKCIHVEMDSAVFPTHVGHELMKRLRSKVQRLCLQYRTHCGDSGQTEGMNS